MKGENKMQSELQEVQRYGRNKNTIVNHSYINRGEYRKKVYRKMGYDDFNSQIFALKELQSHGDIFFKEV